MLVVAQLDGTGVKLDRLLDLVAAAREPPRAREPVHRLRADSRELGRVALPDEIGVLRLRRLRVVVRDHRRALVGRDPALREPVGERRVEPSSSRLGDRAVGDLAGERVLDRVLVPARELEPAARGDQVALLEQGEVRLPAVEQVAHRRRPEHPADDGRRLQHRLVGGR